jgi:hypothetical protein
MYEVARYGASLERSLNLCAFAVCHAPPKSVILVEVQIGYFSGNQTVTID